MTKYISVSTIVNFAHDAQSYPFPNQEKLKLDILELVKDHPLENVLSCTLSINEIFDTIEQWKSDQLKEVSCDINELVILASKSMQGVNSSRLGQSLINALPNEIVELLPYGASSRIFHETDDDKSFCELSLLLALKTGKTPATINPPLF
jgi:hypothetical protein